MKKVIKIIGTFFIFIIYIVCIYGAKDLDTFFDLFNSYCINTLILYNYLMLRYVKEKDITRKSRKIDEIADIEKEKLSKKCIPDSVGFYIRSGNADYITYDEYGDDYKKSFEYLILFNVGMLLLGILPHIISFFAPEEWMRALVCIFPGIVTNSRNIIDVIMQMVVGVLNLFFVLVGEKELQEINFFVQKLSTNFKSDIKKINDKYIRIRTNVIQNEVIVNNGNQAYFVVQYSKEKKIYRFIMEIGIVVSLVVIAIVGLYENGFNTFFIEGNLFYILYPNLVLLIICMWDNADFYKRIHQHKVTIDEVNINTIQKQENNEVKRLFYEINCGKNSIKSYILTIIEMQEWESLHQSWKETIKL